MFLGAGLAFAATSAGAALILPVKKLKRKLYGAIIAFSAGVMGFAAIEMLLQSHAAAGDVFALAGLALGLCAFLALDRLLPHAHAMVNKNASLAHGKKKAALLAGTITLHNIPEGFAIASAFAASPSLGWLVAVSIAIQDFPEGLLVSAPLSAYGVRSAHSFLWGAFSGFVEFAAAIAGFAFLSMVQAVTPFALAFSAGAMAYVTAFELLPDAFSDKGKMAPLMAFACGVAIAFVLARLFVLN
jgi:zinc transporter, ZIP family